MSPVTRDEFDPRDDNVRHKGTDYYKIQWRLKIKNMRKSKVDSSFESCLVSLHNRLKTLEDSYRVS